ncbi:unnamed protein product [Phytomonas sp. EM1]|nr:unnamed protein product [Phytomonas sp. EM1]|eukprot:CCW62028.1 unnamed protein product [Phytomonas sp. isolate EM1]
MNLDFSRKGLFIFDASALNNGLRGCSESADEIESALPKFLDHPPCVRAINLSNNSIHKFTGGETLRTVTVLDLSFNSLSVLQSASLPPALVKLNLFHNQLTCLDALNQFLPFLEELNAGHNALTSDGIRNLPSTLVNLNLKSNKLEDLTSLSTLNRLVKLDVSKNRLTAPGELRMLINLRDLRHLSIQDNPLTQGQFDVQSIIKIVAPWLSSLDGVTLSHVKNHNMHGDASGKLREEHPAMGSPQKRSCSASKMRADPSIPSTRLTAGRKVYPSIKKQSTKEFLAETKVKELEKMLADAQKAEQQALRQRELLLSQVKGCAKVIQDQSEQLMTLREMISTLKKEEETLKKSTSEAERAFEKAHVSLLSCRVSNSTHS